MTPTEPDGALPQWAINALLWFVVALVGLGTTMLGWFMRKYVFLKMEEHEKQFVAHGKQFEDLPKVYATLVMVKELKDVLPDFVSRGEFLAHIRQIAEDAKERHENNREDRQRQHMENLARIADLTASFRDMHARIDQVLRNGS